MFYSKLPVVTLLFAVSVSVSLPAFAQSFMSVDSKGDIYDLSGQKVKTLITAPAPTMVSPAVVLIPGAPQTIVTPLAETGSSPIISPIVPKSASTAVIAPLMDEEQLPATVTRTTVTTSSVPSIDLGTNSLPTVLLSVIDSRRSELERQVAYLDSAQSIMLQAQLKKIADAEATARTGSGLSYERALSLAADLDTVANQLFMANQSLRLSPLVILDHAGGRQIAVTDMMF